MQLSKTPKDMKKSETFLVIVIQLVRPEFRDFDSTPVLEPLNQSATMAISITIFAGLTSKDYKTFARGSHQSLINITVQIGYF